MDNSTSTTPPSTYSVLSDRSHSTPYKAHPNVSASHGDQFPLSSDERDDRDRRLRKISAEMDYQWIGPTEPDQFLDTFLPPSAEANPDLTDARVAELAKTLCESKKLNENQFTSRVVSDT